MAPKTQLTRRHAFASFRERVDLLKIEPARSLSKRVHDNVESLHFLATLEHWREVNVSGVFTDFCDEIESLCQTLPQILHHQKEIFDSLFKQILRSDEHAIQPLLELLAQFVHDMGEDFMPYYDQTLRLLTAVAMAADPNLQKEKGPSKVTKKENEETEEKDEKDDHVEEIPVSDENIAFQTIKVTVSSSLGGKHASTVLESAFNCLAFIFKYLSRTLATDLIPTMSLLSPLLSVTKQTHVARFCAEALSFLVRKLKAPALKSLTNYVFASDLLDNDTYHDALVVLFSESMTNTAGTFHSKAPLVLSALVETALESTFLAVSVACDVLLAAVDHGSSASVDRFYVQVTEYLNRVLQNGESTTLIAVSRLLTALFFADSGKKVSSWAPLLSTTRKLANQMAGLSQDSDAFDSFITLLVVVFRNAPIKDLTGAHKELFEAALVSGRFLALVESSLVTNEEKFLAFGSSFIQGYVNKIPLDDSSLQQLAYFLARSNDELKVSVTARIQTHVISQIEGGTTELSSLYWRLLLLSHTGIDASKTGLFISLFKDMEKDSRLAHDIAAGIIGLLAESLKDESQIKESFCIIQENFGKFRESSVFVAASHKFITKHSISVPQSLLVELAANLSYPEHDIREKSISLLIAASGKHSSSILSEIKVIEQVPLTISNGRDIESRIRTLANNFQALSEPSDIEKVLVGNFMVGLLANKFQPCWTAVYESLPKLGACHGELWLLLFALVKMNYTAQVEPYRDSSDAAFEKEISSWNCRNIRLLGFVYSVITNHLSKYANIESSLFENAENSRSNNSQSYVIRNRAIHALSVIPSVAESHSEDIIPLVLGKVDENTEDELWPLKDRTELINLLTKFNHLKKVAHSDRLYEHVMRLLAHKHSQVQKMAIEVLFNWRIPAVNKYRDNLRNLLDDAIFRDELSKFTAADSTFEEQDLPLLMPFVLRILFGKAQGSPKSNSKNGKKFAAFSVLHNFSDDDIAAFLAIGTDKLAYQQYFLTQEIGYGDSDTLRKANGYVSLLNEIYGVLGAKHSAALETTIEPLLYVLILAQNVIGQGPDKTARIVRTNGMRALSSLFGLLGSYSWDKYISTIYEAILHPRLRLFAEENLQQPSALLRIMTGWIEYPNLHQFLWVDDCAPARAIVLLLHSEHLKESVLLGVLEFCMAALSERAVDDRFYAVLAILVDALLTTLPSIISRTTSIEANSQAVAILLLILDGGYVDENDTRGSLVGALSSALEKPPTQLSAKDKASVLLALSALVRDYDCSFDDIRELYETCAKAFRVHRDKNIRQTLVGVFTSIGDRFIEYDGIARLLADLNSYSEKRMHEYDFERRLDAFRAINDTQFREFTPTQWLPVIYCALHFINDPEELAIRTNAGYTLCRFADGFLERLETEATPYVEMLREVVLPHIRTGLRRPNDAVRTENVGVLEHLVAHGAYVPEFASMKALLFDEEANFFRDICHIQLHRRQTALRMLATARGLLSDSCIAHYLLPIVENYAVCRDEKLRNIATDAVQCVGALLTCVTWSQYKAVLRRYMSDVRGAKEDLRDRVNVVVAAGSALAAAGGKPSPFIGTGLVTHVQTEGDADGTESDADSKGESGADANAPANGADALHADAPDAATGTLARDLPDKELLTQYILRDIVPALSKVLNVRDDDTIVARAPLAEALTSFVTCLSPDTLEATLPGLLTNTCQVMRSRSEGLRDAVRKTLGRIARILGARYVRFIVRELQGALLRGSQIHVLAFTVHLLLAALSSTLGDGDLDDAAPVLVDVIMEDTFGAAGQEKDAEGYTSKMKEVKHKKSYDTAEVLAAHILLSVFSVLVAPIRLLLRETLSHKTEHKLDELMRRYALGLHHNAGAGTPQMLVLCYELHQQAAGPEMPKKAISEKELHFLVQTQRKTHGPPVAHLQAAHALHTLSWDLMRTALARHPHLVTVANIEGFLPEIRAALGCGNERVTVAALKVLNMVVRLPFSDAVDQDLQSFAATCVDFVQDSPTTTTDLCQAALRFLATVMRHKAEVPVSDATVSYVLTRVQPDLDEPNRQGLAFGFLRAVVARHRMLPEVYDVMDVVARIMVVNHTREIRDMARTVYFQFLMEYDQGRGRLDKQFRFLVNNLGYATPDGRMSVMELVHQLVAKAGAEFLAKVATSFFVALANVAVADESAKCREMAVALIATIFAAVGPKNDALVAYTGAWMRLQNRMLHRCGCSVYKAYLGEFGVGKDPLLDAAAVDVVTKTLQASKDKESDDSDVSWEDVYSVLSVFSAISSSLKDGVFAAAYEPVWSAIVDALLYPHAWVRLIGARLVGLLLSHIGNLGFEVLEYELQTIAYRLLHQLGAPSVSKDLGDQIVRNLVTIVMRWEKHEVKYQRSDKNEQDENEPQYVFATDYVVARICTVMRQERHYRESFNSKLSSVKCAAMLVQVLSGERAHAAAEKLLLALYNFTEIEPNGSQESELLDNTRECMMLIEAKLGVSEYTKVYQNVKRIVDERRRDRRTKRVQMAITAPDVAAKRKLKKHERGREKRKQDKDANGFYRSKKQRFAKS